MKFQYKNGHYNKEDDMKTLKKYSLLLILLVITGICTCCVTAEPVHAKTYKIRTASDWKNIGKKNGGTFKLMKDIKLTSEKQYLTISKNKKYTIDLNGHKVATTYSGVNLRTVCPLTVKKGTVILKSSKKNKGVLYSTEAAAVTVTGSAKFYLKSGAIVDDAVEFRSDVTSAVALADKAKCYISGASMVQSIGNGVAMLGKSKLYLTGHPYIRAGANNNTGQFTHYGNGIAVMESGCTLSLKGGSIGTKASPDIEVYSLGVKYTYPQSANYPVLDLSGKVLKTAAGYKYVDAKGAAVPISGNMLESIYPGITSSIGGDTKLKTSVADAEGYYTIYVVKG